MQEETKAEYFARKIAEYDEAMTKAYGTGWTSQKGEWYNEWYITDRGFFYAGLDEFLYWLKDNE